MSKQKNRILIASGSFKDVFSPIEICELINNIIKDIKPGISIDKVPMSDGGEWSSEILTDSLGFKKINVQDVIDPRGMKKDTYYVQLDDKTVFIAASSILKLSPNLSEFKNPLNLTTYGYGQLIKDAIDKGFKKILLGMGGTSTVDGGIGMAQALGLEFLGVDKTKYLTGRDLPKISKIEKNKLQENYDKLDIRILCDSSITIKQTNIPTSLKVSDYFKNEKENIIKITYDGLLKYSKVVSEYINSNGLIREINHKTLENQDYFGNSGGLMLSLLVLFNIHPSFGVEFFHKKFNLKKLIRESDLVITGEGRLDESSLCGKTPIGISGLAKKFNKPVIYLVGDIDESFKKYFNSYISEDLPPKFIDTGITTVISCHPFYDSKNIPKEYQSKINFYRNSTIKILSKELKKYLKEKI